MPNSTRKNTLFIEDGEGRLRRRWLRNGKPGNLQTLREMRTITRAPLGLDGNYLDEQLREKAVEICQAFNARDWTGRVNALFQFVKNLVYFIPDPAGGNDDIETARDVIRLGFADCDGMATTLATLLAMVGVNVGFRAARYANVDGYQHVYVVAFNRKGSPVALDPTYANSYVGWEARAVESVTLPILGESDQVELDKQQAELGGPTFSPGTQRIIGGAVGAGSQAAAGNVKGAAIAGVSMAVSFIPIVGPFLAPVVGLIAGLFHHGPTAQQRELGSSFDVADKQVAAYLLTLNSKASGGTLTGSDVAEAASQITQLAQLATESMAQDRSGYVQKQWKGHAGDVGEEKRYATWLTDLVAKVVPGSEGTVQAAVQGPDQNSVATAAGVTPIQPATSGGGGGGAVESIAKTVSNALTFTQPDGGVDYGKIFLLGLAGFAIYKIAKH